MTYPMYIDGRWDGGFGATKDVVNPATGKVIGQIVMGTPEDVHRAVLAAQRVRKQLYDMTVFERAEMLVRIADAIDSHHEEIAKLLSEEHGKPYREALGEISGSALAFRECAEQIKWMDSVIVPLRERNRRCLVFHKPKGVFGIITPWNYPISSAVVYYIAPGLAAGCPIIWKPATSTAAVCSAFMKCIEDAKVPAGFVSMVIGSGPVVGDALAMHPLVVGIGFTGSTETGHRICARAAKFTMMELGGNGPSIVLKDADLELAAEKLMRGSFTNAGQICTSTERVLVDDSVADRLVEIMFSKMSDYVLGDPFDPKTTMGPMHLMDTVGIVLTHIEDAIQKGAKVVTGGGRQPGSPTEHYIEPTILDHVSPDTLLNIEETFGPVLPLIRFKNESEIPALVEKSPYRLFGSIFTKDLDKALMMADQYNFGSMNINEGSNSWDTMIPAGGGAGSASGHGRSGGKYSIKEFLEERVVLLNLQTEM
jgi:acyl-CoA reductase-like NAD-dependent aldehyde dehydrogenase